MYNKEMLFFIGFIGILLVIFLIIEGILLFRKNHKASGLALIVAAFPAIYAIVLGVVNELGRMRVFASNTAIRELGSLLYKTLNLLRLPMNLVLLIMFQLSLLLIGLALLPLLKGGRSSSRFIYQSDDTTPEQTSRVLYQPEPVEPPLVANLDHIRLEFISTQSASEEDN